MASERKRDFCPECRKVTEYELKKVPITKTIRDKEYKFSITEAYCKECGTEIGVHGLMDRNAQEIDEQYRSKEGIITIPEIKNLMEMYDLGKTPLSLALGFGEVTIPRYLKGQIPSKEYSDIMRRALRSTDVMEDLLIKNRAKIGETAYKKAEKSINKLKGLFSLVTAKQIMVISRIFTQTWEVTPLMLQKLLYYINSIFETLYYRPVFDEPCEAWVHGPVYKNVYSLFRDFKYNPIDDERFSLLEGYSEGLTNEEKNVIDMVTDSFGVYSGKTLEKITHKEDPWKNAREGYPDNEPSNEIISEESIKQYFTNVNDSYDLSTSGGINDYINHMLA